MFHLPVGEPVGQAAGDITRPIVGKQSRPLHDPGVVAAWCRKRQVERVGDVLCPHCLCIRWYSENH